MIKIIEIISNNLKSLEVERIGEDLKEQASLKDFEKACERNAPEIKKNNQIVVKEDSDYYLILKY